MSESGRDAYTWGGPCADPARTHRPRCCTRPMTVRVTVRRLVLAAVWVLLMATAFLVLDLYT